MPWAGENQKFCGTTLPAMAQAAGVPRGVSAVRWKKVGLGYWSPASRKALGEARGINSNSGHVLLCSAFYIPGVASTSPGPSQSLPLNSSSPSFRGELPAPQLEVRWCHSKPPHKFPPFPGAPCKGHMCMSSLHKSFTSKAVWWQQY